MATRRLRSDLRTFGPLLDEAWTRALRDELGWIAGLLGSVRDADVLLERLHAQAGRLPKCDAEAADILLARLQRDQRAGTEALHAAMETERYVALLDRLVAAAAQPQFAPAPAPTSASASAPRPASTPPARHAAAAAAATAAANAPTPAPHTAATPDAHAAPSMTPHAPPVAPEPAARTWPTAVWSRPHAAPDISNTGPPATGTVVADTPAATGTPADATVGQPRPADGPAVEVLTPLVRRPWRHLDRLMGGLGPAPEDDVLHEVRIRAKRCRYAAEAVAPALGKEASRFAEGIAELQGVLGDLHDAVVAEAWLRDAVARAPAAQALAAGQLVAMERADADASRTSWRGVWKQASAKKGRAWLNP